MCYIYLDQILVSCIEFSYLEHKLVPVFRDGPFDIQGGGVGIFWKKMFVSQQ